MTKHRINGHSPARNALMSIVNACIDENRPFYLSRVAHDLHRSDSAIKKSLFLMRDVGLIGVEYARDTQGMRYRISLPDGRATPWPVDYQAPDPKPRGEEIIHRRLSVEQNREAQRRYWLQRERAPRRAPEPRQFMDKATVLALQGIHHG